MVYIRCMDEARSDDVTIVIPVYNESDFIGETVKHYNSMNFNNVLIVNDNSTDSLVDSLKSMNVQVISSSQTNGYAVSLLRGLYAVKTKYALVIDPDVKIEAGTMRDFLNFSKSGNYGLLLSKRSAPYNRRDFGKVSKYMKQKFGVFINEPDFRATLIDRRMLDLLLSEQSSTDLHVFQSLITIAARAKLKISTYSVANQVRLGVGGKWKVTRRRPRIFRYGLRHFIRHRQIIKNSPSSLSKQYYTYAFPDFEKQKFIRQAIYGIVSAVIGGGIAIGVSYVIKQPK